MPVVELDPVFALFATAIAVCLVVIGTGTVVDHYRQRRRRRRYVQSMHPSHWEE